MAGGCIRTWVTAITWTTGLRFRSPVRFRRQRSLLPEETGSTAVPMCIAKAASRVKREAPAICPARWAAEIAEQPGISIMELTRFR